MTPGWFKSYILGATAAAVIATGAFVSYRNHSFVARELARAERAAQAEARGEAPAEAVIAAGVVSAPVRSQRYPFLSQRRLRNGRLLGGPDAAPTDKLLYDAATRAETAGRYARFLEDGSLNQGGLVVAALPGPDGVAVAVLRPPGEPEAFPWLVMLGLLAVGALVAAAGAMVDGAARTAGLALGLSGLAVPAYLWGGLGPALGVALVSGGIALADRAGWIRRAAAELRRNRAAYSFLAPTGLAMAVLVAVPFVFGLVLGFYNHHHGEWTFVGLDNFAEILFGGGQSLNFWFTLGVTVAWTAVNVALHASIGVVLALALRQTWLRGKGVFRVLLILPWAIPNYITALIWNGMFQSEYGAINGLLELLGLERVSWFSEWATAFTANVCTNTWLGFPFMMVVALGALESIPTDMYEAAEVDGASSWKRFVHITLPHLRPAMVPAMVLGAIWTFNMFNVIYLVSEGRPDGGTDILVTEAYRWAFERGERYGLAAAYATLIFLVLLLWTVFGTRVLKNDQESA